MVKVWQLFGGETFAGAWWWAFPEVQRRLLAFRGCEDADEKIVDRVDGGIIWAMAGYIRHLMSPWIVTHELAIVDLRDEAGATDGITDVPDIEDSHGWV